MTDFPPPPPLPTLARYAVIVDVGYIYAAAGELLFNTASRREFRVDADKLIGALTRHADGFVRGELLRVYWYDAARDRVPTIDQRVIAQMAWVKLRLGNLNARGQQKGVDAQIRADMEALARHRAITDAVLIAGDEDMVPAVEAAQAFGVRVHLWGVEPPFGTNQAERLVWEADTVEVLDRPFLEPYFTRQPAAHRAASRPVVGVAVGALARAVVRRAARAAAPAVPARAQAGGRRRRRLGPDRERVEEAGEHVAHKWILTRGADNIRDLLPGPILPPVIDKELLVDAEKELGLSLRPYQEAREWLRDAFWARVRREFAVGARDDGPEPLLRVVRGEPTAEEIAALAVVLAAKLAATPGVRPRWACRPAAGRTARVRCTSRRPRAPAPGAEASRDARGRRPAPGHRVRQGSVRGG